MDHITKKNDWWINNKKILENRATTDQIRIIFSRKTNLTYFGSGHFINYPLKMSDSIGLPISVL